ncbi:uncharacterized protein Hap1MRO34_022653 [Clarias gariepinus]
MTEGWCYGSMSVVAPRKGHYCHRGLWEMTPDVLLLILALTACLTEPVRSEEDDGSGVQEKEAQVAKQMTSMTTIIHTSEVISVSDNPITVSTQDAEVSGLAETLAQVTSEKNSTEISNETHTKARNVTTEVKHDKGRKLPTNDTAGDEEDHQEEDENMGSSPEPEKTDDQETYIIVAASVTLAVLLAAAVVGLLFLCRRRRKNTPGEVELGMDFLESLPAHFRAFSFLSPSSLTALTPPVMPKLCVCLAQARRQSDPQRPHPVTHCQRPVSRHHCTLPETLWSDARGRRSCPPVVQGEPARYRASCFYNVMADRRAPCEMNTSD